MSKIIELTQGRFAIVDDDDYERLTGFTPQITTRNDTPRKYKWYFDKGRGYATAVYGGRKNKTHVKMHRLVMNAPAGVEVDHKNGDRLDNRKENLRLATRGQNAKNILKYATGSQYKGVTPHRAKYAAQIQVNGVHHNLGHYATELVAAVAYDKACREHFGEFGKPNFADEQFTLLWDKYKDEIENPKRRAGNSKYVGVYFSARDQVWRAQFAYKGKVYPVGTFKTEEDAHQARETAKAGFLRAVAA